VLTKNERKFISHCINTNKDPFAAFCLTMKVHKAPLKSRPIVSCSGSLFFALGKWVDDKLKIFAHRQPAYFKSSQDLQTMLSTMVIPPHTFFFTEDAESMYTNIDTNRALAYISSYSLYHAAEFEFYYVEALIKALKIFMKNSIFTFSDAYWRQDSGTAMGTPPAPQWANIFYALCDNQFVPQFLPNLIFYKRFIDDVLGMWTITNSATNTASWESYIQAMKLEDYGLTCIVSPLSDKVDFMDLTIRIDGASITTTLYEKPSNFHLYIPPPPTLVAHRDFSGAWYGMLYRIYTPCSDQDDRQVRTTAFYHHLQQRGYESKDLHPLFHLAITKAKARETEPSPAPANQAYVCTYQLFHLEYHPRNPPSRDFQAA
jgi:hypothetical protein